jgi:hypothetical protein
VKLVRYEDWARPGLPHPGTEGMFLPVARVYIHHTVSPQPINGDAEVMLLRSIDAAHRAKGWAGIGYSFIVGPSGTVYEGRGQRVGAHTEGKNYTSFGVAFLGTFLVSIPQSTAMVAAAELLAHLQAAGVLQAGYKVGGHRDVKATACPGDGLYRQLPELARLATSIIPPAPPTNGDPVPDPVVPAPMPDYPSNAAPVGIAGTGSPNGYWILAADGGVFSFGDAQYKGRVHVTV